jgi:hypothetical protein
MNARSSRSHAIFTITVEQRRMPASPAPQGGGASGDASGDDEEEEEAVDDYLCAKMHLVDLAGGGSCALRALLAAHAPPVLPCSLWQVHTVPIACHSRRHAKPMSAPRSLQKCIQGEPSQGSRADMQQCQR